MRVAFAGSPAPAAAVLRTLASSRHEVRLVISQPDRRRGRSGAATPTPAAQEAERLGIPCLRPATINDPEIVGRLRDEGIGALCVVAFGQLVKEPILSEWPCINVHFSLLPAYRGAAPVERALMDGVAETGVTIMRMEAGLDTGPVVSVHRTSVGPDEDAGVVMDRLCDLGGPALVDAVDRVESGTFDPVPQPEEGVSLAPKITDADRVLDTGLTARALTDRIRALSPHVGVRCTIGGEPFKVWRAAPSPLPAGEGLAVTDGRLLLACADGALEILELQPPSKARMAAGAFLRGWRGTLELA